MFIKKNYLENNTSIKKTPIKLFIQKKIIKESQWKKIASKKWILSIIIVWDFDCNMDKKKPSVIMLSIPFH